MLTKSYLDSANIPFHEEFGHMAHICPALPLFGLNNTALYIIDEYYDEALALLEEYISKKTESNEGRKRDKLRYVAEYIVGGIGVPKNKDTTIVIFRKQELK